VLRALLWGFHNQHTGRCFPSYERIAEAASVSRATVARAIAALEAAGLLTWQNRLVRQRVAMDGLLGPTWTLIPRRTSNAYCFRDPQPLSGCPEPKSQNSTGTRNQVSINLSVQTETDLDPDSPLSRALNRLKNAIDRHPLPTKEDA
jgi:DNA-binding transcriptional MocR family regulator